MEWSVWFAIQTLWTQFSTKFPWLESKTWIPMLPNSIHMMYVTRERPLHSYVLLKRHVFNYTIAKKYLKAVSFVNEQIQHHLRQNHRWLWQIHRCCAHPHTPYSHTLFPHSQLRPLTHLPLDKMSAISQTIFSDAFSWIKSFVFWLKFHWSLFLRVQLTISQYWFR